MNHGIAYLQYVHYNAGEVYIEDYHNVEMLK